jgi:hypothetical protein
MYAHSRGRVSSCQGQIAMFLASGMRQADENPRPVGATFTAFAAYIFVVDGFLLMAWRFMTEMRASSAV